MMEDEKCLMDQWQHVEVVGPHEGCWWVIVGTEMLEYRYATPTARSREDAILLAAEFTRTRLEQIRQVEREITWLEETIDFDWFVDEARRAKDWSGKCFGVVARSTHTMARILAREQAALADLKRGMVERTER
jgi:hypothetical protein